MYMNIYVYIYVYTYMYVYISSCSGSTLHGVFLRPAGARRVTPAATAVGAN